MQSVNVQVSRLKCQVFPFLHFTLSHFSVDGAMAQEGC